MLLLHWPSWFDIQEVKGDAESWIDRFKDFFASDDCPTFVKAQVAKARRFADHPQEPVFEEDEEDDAVEAEEQPDWVDVYAGQNQIYEGVERDFDYEDGGEDYDWSSTRIILPEGKDPTKWLQESIKADDERETESTDLDLPQVCPLSLNENQKAIVGLVLHTLYNFVAAPIVIVIQSGHLKHSISPEKQSAKHKDSGFFGIKRGCNWLGAMKGIALWSRGFSRGSLKTWPKPETAHEKPLAPRVRFSVIEEVELSNMRTAYVIHIPNTLSLTSKRNNRKQKFLQSTSF